MTNLINSPNIQNYNAVYSPKTYTENKPRFVQAPDSLPKYSIEKEFQEKQNIRKDITINQNKTLNKKKKNILPKIIAVAAATAGYLLLKRKK